MNRKTVYRLISVLFAVIAFVSILLYMASRKSPDPLPVSVSEETSQSISGNGDSEEEEYVSPIDFEALKKESSDIYAWINIPGTKVDYPVLSHEGDEDYYLRRDIYGNYLFRGSLYTQSSYNRLDFSDRVVIIYGHNMTDGTLFGDLQRIYSNEETFREYPEFTIYLPDRELDYEVIAGIPFSDWHIMEMYNRFEEEDNVKEFLNYCMNVHDLKAVKLSGYRPTGTEHLVILETCQYNNYDERFIVVGRLKE